MALLDGRKDPGEPKVEQIAGSLGGLPEILGDELAGGLSEDEVDLLEGLVLGLGHEEDLVEPAEDGDAAVEAEGEAGLGHDPLHVGEEVGDEPAAEEEVDVGRLHAVGAQVGGEDLRGQHPRQARVRAEEAVVDDDAGQVEAGGAREVAGRDLVRDADQDQAEEEAGEHQVGPEAAAEALHVQDAGDRAEE